MANKIYPISLPDEMNRELDRLAQHEDRTKAWLIKKAIKKIYMDEKKK